MTKKEALESKVHKMHKNYEAISKGLEAYLLADKGIGIDVRDYLWTEIFIPLDFRSICTFAIFHDLRGD